MSSRPVRRDDGQHPRPTSRKPRGMSIGIVLLVAVVVVTVGGALATMSTLSLNFSRQVLSNRQAEALAGAAVAQIMYDMDETVRQQSAAVALQGGGQYSSLKDIDYKLAERYANGIVFTKGATRLLQSIGSDGTVSISFAGPYRSVDNLTSDTSTLGWAGTVPPFTTDIIVTVRIGSEDRHYEALLGRIWPFGAYCNESSTVVSASHIYGSVFGADVTLNAGTTVNGDACAPQDVPVVTVTGADLIGSARQFARLDGVTGLLGAVGMARCDPDEYNVDMSQCVSVDEVNKWAPPDKDDPMKDEKGPPVELYDSKGALINWGGLGDTYFRLGQMSGTLSSKVGLDTLLLKGTLVLDGTKGTSVFRCPSITNHVLQARRDLLKPDPDQPEPGDPTYVHSLVAELHTNGNLVLKDAVLLVNGSLDVQSISGENSTLVVLRNLTLRNGTLDAQNKGMLIVAGNVDLQANGDFRGLIACQGKLNIAGGGLKVRGGVMSGGGRPAEAEEISDLNMVLNGADVRRDAQFTRALNRYGITTIRLFREIP